MTEFDRLHETIRDLVEDFEAPDIVDMLLQEVEYAAEALPEDFRKDKENLLLDAKILTLAAEALHKARNIPECTCREQFEKTKAEFKELREEAEDVLKQHGLLNAFDQAFARLRRRGDAVLRTGGPEQHRRLAEVVEAEVGELIRLTQGAKEVTR